MNAETSCYLHLGALVPLLFATPILAAHAPQGAPLQTNETHVVYAGGDGTSFRDAVVIKGVTNLIDLILAEGRWLSNNYPGFQIKGIIPSPRLKTGLYDVTEIRTAERRETKIHFSFSEKSLAETPIDALWQFYINDLIRPYGDSFRWIYRLSVEEHMKRNDPKCALPFLVAQLEDERVTNTSSIDPWGDGKLLRQRVCDFTVRLILDDLRYLRSKEAVFPQYSWKLFKRSRVREKPDEAIEAIKNWWHMEGQFLTEHGEIEWGRKPLLDETSKANGK